MTEVKRTEDQLVFIDGTKIIRFKRLKSGVAMDVNGMDSDDAVLTVKNLVSYISWEHHVNMEDVEHGKGLSPHTDDDNNSNNWDRLIE